MSSEDFAIFTSNNDFNSTVLQAHFLALEMVMRPWLISEYEGRGEIRKENGVAILPRSATLGDPGLDTQLMAWPLKILEKAERIKQ